METYINNDYTKQVTYWMFSVTEFPFRWTAAFDVRRSSTERSAILFEGWSRYLCCKHPDFDRKMGSVYGCFTELERCKCFESSVQGLGSRGMVTNMKNERLFAQVKRATPSKLPYAERVLAAGLLTQWLRPHIADGGTDPRITTRQELLAAGVPIQAQQKCEKTLKGGLHANMMFANDEVSKIAAHREQVNGSKLSRAERATLLSEFCKAFANEPSDIQERYVEKVNDQRTIRRDAADADDAPSDDAKAYNSARRWDCCSVDEPILADMLNSMWASKAAPGNIGGLSCTMSRMREEFANVSVCMDYGDIPANHRVKYFTDCSSKHRGVCQYKDRANYNLLLEVANRINELLLDTEKFADGDWRNVSLVRQGGVKQMYTYLAHQRFRDPRIALLAQVDNFPQSDGSLKLEYRLGDVIDQTTPYTVCRILLNGSTDTVFDVVVEAFNVRNYNFCIEEEQRAIGCVQVVSSRAEFKIYDCVLETASLTQSTASAAKAAKKDAKSTEGKYEEENADLSPGSGDEFSKGFDSMRKAAERSRKPRAPRAAGVVRVVDNTVKKALENIQETALDALATEVVDEDESDYHSDYVDKCNDADVSEILHAANGKYADPLAPPKLTPVKAKSLATPIVLPTLKPPPTKAVDFETEQTPGLGPLQPKIAPSKATGIPALVPDEVAKAIGISDFATEDDDPFHDLYAFAFGEPVPEAVPKASDVAGCLLGAVAEGDNCI